MLREGPGLWRVLDLTAAGAVKLSIVEELEAGQRGPTDTSVGVQLTGNESMNDNFTISHRKL